MGANPQESRLSNWRTPKDFFDTLNEEFNFNLDAAADSENALCGLYLTKEMDALSIGWHKISVDNKPPVVWLNPPYGRGLNKWVKKAYEEYLQGCIVVCLLPPSVDTHWFHNYVVEKGAEIRFIRGRLKFIDPRTGEPGKAPCKGNILVIYRR